MSDETTSSERVLRVPFSAATEEAVLSAWSLHESFGKAWPIEPELFHVPAHRAIASAMAKLNGARDQSSIFAQLDADGTMLRAGGKGRVYALLTGAADYGDPWVHVTKLRELAALRTLITKLETAVTKARSTSDLSVTVAAVQEAMRACGTSSKSRMFSVRDMIAATAEVMVARGQSTAVSTGLPSLDNDCGGFQRGQVTMFGAGTSVGKSSYALYVADLALQKGLRPLIVSAEDSEELYGRRLAGRRANVNPAALRPGATLDEDGFNRVLVVADRAEKQLFFINAVGVPAETIASDIRCVCAAEKIDIVIVDYVQAIQCAKPKGDRRSEISYISRIITDAIKNSGATGLIFSQLKRLPQGQKPSKNDLKECVAGDQLVMDARTGELVMVRDLVNREVTVYGIRENFKLGIGQVQEAWSTGTKNVVSMRTRSGRTLRATPNHTVRTISGWTRIDQLRIGQRIAVPRRLHEPQRADDTLSDDELRLLGYLISDGHYGKNHSVSYVKADMALCDDVRRIAKKRFGITAKLNGDHGASEQLALTAEARRPGGNPIINWLRDLGIHGQVANEKRVPGVLWRHTDRALGVFLGALWAGDGSVFQRKGGGYSLKFTNTSMGLLDDVQWIMSRLGIIGARCLPGRNSLSKHDLASILVTEADAIIQFASVVDVPGMKGERLKAAVAASRAVGRNARIDRLPIEVTEEVTAYAVGAGITYKRMRAELGYKPQSKEMCRFDLARVAAKTGNARFAEVAAGDVLWDEVLSIDPDGRTETFDLSVPGLHNFVVSNVFAHNCGELENQAENVLIGYVNSDGNRVFVADKIKDGFAGNEYPIAWSDVYAGIAGEATTQQPPKGFRRP